MLKGSFFGCFCVRRTSCVVNNFFKHLLPNCWANLDQTLEVLFKNCSKNLIPSKTGVAMATKWNFLSGSLKNILCNRWSDFDPFQNFFVKFDLSINMALVNRGFLHYTNIKKFLKKIVGPILK